MCLYACISYIIHIYIYIHCLFPPEHIRCEHIRCEHWKKLTAIIEIICHSVLAGFISHVWLFETPWKIACQAPLSTEFSRQEYWSKLPFPTQSQPRDWTQVSHVSCISRQIPYHCTTWRALSGRGCKLNPKGLLSKNSMAKVKFSKNLNKQNTQRQNVLGR